MHSGLQSYDLVAGTVAGAGQLIVGHPFDTVKVKLQTQPGKYTGGVDAARKVLATHGPKGFFKGLSTPLVTVAAYNAVLFASRGSMERLLAHPDGSPLTITDHFLCGAGAGLAGSFVACPTELVKCRLQARSGAMPQVLSPAVSIAGMSTPALLAAAPVASPLAVIRQVVNAGGVRSLYRGMVPTLGREVGGSAAMFATYELTKRQFAHAQGIDTAQLDVGSLLAAGGIAGISFWLTIFPFDVIKSKLQTDDLHNRRYRGMLDCARQVYAERGVSSLFCGLQVCMCHEADVALQTALNILKCMRPADKHWTDDSHPGLRFLQSAL